LELKLNYTILTNSRKLTIAPKATLSKKAASTREEYKIQLGLEIEDDSNTIDVHDQIRALAAN